MKGQLSFISVQSRARNSCRAFQAAAEGPPHSPCGIDGILAARALSPEIGTISRLSAEIKCSCNGRDNELAKNIKIRISV